MPSRYIYVFASGSHDPSRWLHISARNDGECILHLQDLCHPGKLSLLTTASCPLAFLKTAIERGPLQINTGKGYVLLRIVDDLLQIEFRASEDVTTTKVSVRAEEVRNRLTQLSADSADLALAQR